ncbi:hypothetical protein COEREDRAFT_81687 [Coemansia reversa NRRL 1564]|uniref:Uncharacterized protein n=1 Tax=Coemansia reversa (strain ATCC 12441 / NRRL 1564) TaxID=763665 RepID=A0A2G5BAH4_COERN|nr:hypothetical protein COEREDRAFT_81687 [Coemansia reversa NRRL 1564]|eukprot:PIA16000.1 hypothetical protein COEREDRAFT_81687 [Coemansia reversa NRRL 1564]
MSCSKANRHWMPSAYQCTAKTNTNHTANGTAAHAQMTPCTQRKHTTLMAQTCHTK